MEFDINNIEDSLFDLIDEFKVLLSEDTWENILMNCTKNELFVLMLLYRQSDVNMTQIADYLNTPLNTATGIVSRMEKKSMIERVRSSSDKRVVTIITTESGKEQINAIMKVFIGYVQDIIGSLSEDELTVMTSVIGKVVKVIKEQPIKEKQKKNKVRKIVIE